MSIEIEDASTVPPAVAWGSVGILMVLSLVSFIDRQIISLLVDPIKADLQLTDTQISLLQGLAFVIFYAVAAMPIGWAVDRYSRRTICYLGITCWSLSAAACGLAGNLWQIFDHLHCRQPGLIARAAMRCAIQLEENSTDLAYLLAVEGVRDLHARYLDAVFRKDYAAFAACWTDDAEWRIAGNVLHGRAEITGFLERAMSNFHRVIMTFRTPILELAGDEARSRVYVTEQNGFKNGRPGATIGTYYEKLVRERGRWLRSWALFQLHYMGPADLTGSYFEQPDYGTPPAFPPPNAIAPNYSKVAE